MPADNVDGFRPEVLALLKELDSPVYRWPGGNFVSGYDWRDGIGDRDRRPPRKNPAWTGVEHNDVGIHEFMALLPPHRRRALHHGQQRPGRRRHGRSRSSSTPTARPTTQMGRLRTRQRPPRALGRQVLGHRQRDVRRLAARPHAALRLRQEAHAVRRGHEGHGPVDPARRGRRGRALERDHAGRGLEPHGPHQRALLRPAQARAPRPRQPGAGRDPADRRGPPEVPGDDPDAQDEGGPGRPRRVELLVRPARLRRARDAVLPRGRAGHRGRPQRVRPPVATSTSWPTTPRRSTSSGPSRRRRRRPCSTRRASSWRSTASTSGRSRSPSAERPSRSTSWPAGRTRRKAS